MDNVIAPSSNRKAFRQLFIMILLTFITQAVTLIKLSVTASNFGATVQMDAFNFANNIGTFIFSFIGTGVTTVLIPAIISQKSQKSMNNFITVLYGASVIIIFIIFFNRRLIVSTFAPKSYDFIEITCNIMFITLISQFLNTILGVTNAVFQCNDKFNIPKICTLFTTIILTALVYINKDLSIYQYSFYILITMLLNVVSQVIILRKDKFRYYLCINFKDEELNGMMKIFIPTMFSTGLYQISLLTDSMISTTLGQGQISILNYSNSIMSMINMLLVGNLMTYIYPRITKDIINNDDQNKLFEYVNFFGGIMCLMAVGFIVVGKETITLLYQRGQFNSSITEIVFMCSVIYMIGLPINVMRDVIYRYFYAKGNTKTTFYNSVCSSFINIGVSILLSFFIGIYGVVLGTVITSIFSFSTILIRFKNQYGLNINKFYYLKENLKLFCLSVIIIFTLLKIKDIFLISNILLNILVYGTLTVILFIVLLFVFKSSILKIKI